MPMDQANSELNQSAIQTRNLSLVPTPHERAPSNAEGYGPVRPEGLEPPTPGSEVRCSIQLSYRR